MSLDTRFRRLRPCHFSTADETAPDREVGEVSIVRHGSDELELIVVGRAASGLFACERLLATDTQREGATLIVKLRRSPFAFSCNDDELPAAVRFKLPSTQLEGVNAIRVMQDGSVLSFTSLRNHQASDTHTVPGRLT